MTHTTMPLMLSDHLMDALASLGRARSQLENEHIVHRAAVIHELTQAELSLARLLGLIAGAPEG